MSAYHLPRGLILFVVSLILTPRLIAAESENELILNAYQLWQKGDPRAAMQILERVTQSARSQQTADQGQAWNLLGLTYLDLGMHEKARASLERSIEILRPIPSAKAVYASALDNLGSLESVRGNWADSERLRQKALGIYELLEDHAGIARVSSNLAVLALAHKDFSEARTEIRFALEESRKIATPDDDDTAAMMSVEGTLALVDHDPPESLSYFKQALQLWSRSHGASSSQAGIGLALRAQAYERVGDLMNASADAQRASEIFSTTPGRDTSLYWKTVLLQAKIMKAQGRKAEGRTLEKTATKSLRGLESQSCQTCTVTAQAFH